LKNQQTARKLTANQLITARDTAPKEASAMAAPLAGRRDEIRDHITTIIDATAKLLDTRLDARQHELVARVSSSGQALLAMLSESADRGQIVDRSEDSFDQLREIPIAPDVAIACATDILIHEAAARDSEFPVIDMTAITKVAEADEPGSNFLVDIIEVFLSDLAKRIGSIKLALQRSDDALMGATAHSIKGSCGHFGARYLMELCGDVEARAQRGETRGLDVTVNSLIAESERVRAALQIYRHKPAPPAI